MSFAANFPVMLRTDDGVRIDAAHTPSRGRGDLGIVVAHGFTGSWRDRTARRIVHVLSGFGGVVAFDFRGHGHSGGETTVGDLEVLDLDAAVRHARIIGYSCVAVVGFSMGAAVAVRHAALYRGVDAVAAVSGPPPGGTTGAPSPCGRCTGRSSGLWAGGRRGWSSAPGSPGAGGTLSRWRPTRRRG
ncbi:alpha/beta hydrolase [Nonomuraea dietziae]|uniref:alpha/beta hydrolase n=1 Tax=Nonomuraea dietziae TaxID=65515 RepID=UPI0031D4F2AC